MTNLAVSWWQRVSSNVKHLRVITGHLFTAVASATSTRQSCGTKDVAWGKFWIKQSSLMICKKSWSPKCCEKRQLIYVFEPRIVLGTEIDLWSGWLCWCAGRWHQLILASCSAPTQWTKRRVPVLFICILCVLYYFMKTLMKVVPPTVLPTWRKLH